MLRKIAPALISFTVVAGMVTAPVVAIVAYHILRTLGLQIAPDAPVFAIGLLAFVGAIWEAFVYVVMMRDLTK